MMLIRDDKLHYARKIQVENSSQAELQTQAI